MPVARTRPDGMAVAGEDGERVRRPPRVGKGSLESAVLEDTWLSANEIASRRRGNYLTASAKNIEEKTGGVLGKNRRQNTTWYLIPGA